MENIKYFKPSLGNIMRDMKILNIITQYFIMFNDGSELDLIINPRIMFSMVDMQSGKNRNDFKNKYSADEALNLLRQLENQLGYVDSNEGNIVLVDNSNTKMKIIV